MITATPSILIEGVGDEVLLLMAVLLAGLILVVAWFSTHVPQDTRPITVFVFQNVTRHRRQYSNASTASVATATGSSTVLVATHGVGTQAMDVNSSSASHMHSNDGVSSSIIATLFSDNHLNEPSVPESNSDMAVNGNFVDSETFLDDNENEDLMNEDEALSQQMEEVLQEYSEVIEMHNDESQLRQRRLRYFNCLFGGSSASDVEDTVTPSPPESDLPDCHCSPHDRFLNDISDEETLVPAAVESQTLHQMVTAPQALFSLTDSLPEGTIQLRIKYLDDRQKIVFADPEEDIATFKRKHFHTELSSNMSVRLIFNGHELKEGTGLTLKFYAVPNNATIHCLVTERAEPTDSTSNYITAGNRAQDDTSSSGGPETDMGGLMFPLFAAILGLIWYCRISYRQYFNVMSTFALVGVTLLFIAACIASWAFHQTVRNQTPRGQLPPIMVHRITLDS